MHESRQMLYPLISQIIQNVQEEVDDARLEYLDLDIVENTQAILTLSEGVDEWVQKVQEEGVSMELFILFEEWDERLTQLEQAANRVYFGWSSILARRVSE